jgi:hypothetical protein
MDVSRETLVSDLVFPVFGIFRGCPGGLGNERQAVFV